MKARKKKRPEFTDEERALILQWLEERYKQLYGRGQSSAVAQDRDDVWSNFLIPLNALHDSPMGRTLEELLKKIDNMKTQGKSNKRDNSFYVSFIAKSYILAAGNACKCQT